MTRHILLCRRCRKASFRVELADTPRGLAIDRFVCASCGEAHTQDDSPVRVGTVAEAKPS